MSKETGGPAFPRKRSLHRREIVECSGAPNSDFVHDKPQDGMTLRDWFAGQALCGACNASFEAVAPSPEIMATEAFRYADAMLKERSKL